jgi:hypothetical protein
VAVVTASTQGIGLAIAERLGLEGAAVVISSRKQVQPSRAEAPSRFVSPALLVCVLPVFPWTVLVIGGFCCLTGGVAEERGRRGEGAQGKGDHRGRGRLPRLRRPAAQEPHRHGSQGQNWGRGFQSLRWVTLHSQISFVAQRSRQASWRSMLCRTLLGIKLRQL